MRTPSRKGVSDAGSDRGWHHYPYLGNGAAAGIEMALWDICGKA